MKRWVIALVVVLGLAGLAALGAGMARRNHGAAATQPAQPAGGAELVLLPGGWFEMGSELAADDDAPRHKVFVSPFYLGAREVTQEEFQRVMGENPSKWKEPRNPVEQVRWDKAAAYCNTRSRREGLTPAYNPTTWECDFAASGYRLPTEAEWEFAARAGGAGGSGGAGGAGGSGASGGGGGGGAYSFGDNPALLDRYAWFKSSGPRRPSPVGQKLPNAFGLYDLYGNVWEWCNDYYQETYYRQSPERDPRGPATGTAKVLRGGSWDSKAKDCRSGYRFYEDPGWHDTCFGRDTQGFIGFRVARSVADGAPRP